MATEDVQKAVTTPAQQEVVVVTTDVPEAEKTTTTNTTDVEKEMPQLETEMREEDSKPKQEEEDVRTTEVVKTSGDDAVEKMPQSGSIKEETNKVADLPVNEKKALLELKQLVQEALNKHEFTGNVKPPAPKEEEAKKEAPVHEEEKKPVQESTSESAALEEPAQLETEEMASDKKEQLEKEETVEEIAENAVSDNTVDDDGAKTVEAIEESVVAVSSSSVPQEQQHPADKSPSKELETTKEAVNPSEEPIESKSTEAENPLMAPEKISIWGISLLADERSDVILLKFLRARDFKVKDALTMLKNTIRWRKEFGIDELVEKELDNNDDLEKVVFMHGFGKEGHPVCYNVYGEFQNKELYQKTFADEGKRLNFLKWRIQFLEKSIRKLDFSPGGVCTIVQVNDLKNSPGPAKWELRQATKQALQLFQDNYPEFVAKQVFINVPWWYLTVNKLISPFLTQRTRSKFVFAGPSKSAETLFRYIAAEQVPMKYGGLSKDGEFVTTDAVTEITVKPAAKHTVEFPVTEACRMTWEVRVVGWDINYGAEFVPSSEESYTVIIQKPRKVASTEESVVSDSFKTSEPGKIVITIDNPTSKKKKLLYRLKTKPSNSVCLKNELCCP